MSRPRKRRGVVAQWDDPDRGPLERAVGIVLAGWFMWLYEVRLADGTRLDAYKHQDSRACLHLSADGRAFAYVGEESYREVHVTEAVDRLLEDWFWMRLMRTREPEPDLGEGWPPGP